MSLTRETFIQVLRQGARSLAAKHEAVTFFINQYPVYARTHPTMATRAWTKLDITLEYNPNDTFEALRVHTAFKKLQARVDEIETFNKRIQ